jgi:murein DD-endopeptidase MepM/ murein hydrolase activator NlpD
MRKSNAIGDEEEGVGGTPRGLSWSEMRDQKPASPPSRRRSFRPRLYAAVAIPVAIPLIVAAVNLDPSSGKSVVAAAAVPPLSLRYSDLLEPVKFDLPEHSTVLTFEADDTLGKIFGDGGLQRAEAAKLTAQMAEHIDVRRLRPGHQVRFHYGADGRVDSVQMKVMGWGELTALRSANGFDVTARQAKIHEEETHVAANVRSSLYEALRETGEGPQLVQQLIDVFQWDIDFFELQRGDSFSLVVRKRYADGELLGYGPIMAARFVHDGVTYEAFRDPSHEGAGGYYSATGAPLRKQFLRAPLKFTRITSGFTKRRFHPVLHLFRPHNGVDYGAPTGTPVMTTADGVVLETSFRAGEGNYVRIKHSSRTETWYLHLSKFAKGVKKGTKVTQGDVIGYVGATGLASGPHLDYRVREDGKWIDPLKLKSITPDPLRGNTLAQFRASVKRVQPMLAQPAAQVATAGAKRRALF